MADWVVKFFDGATRQRQSSQYVVTWESLTTDVNHVNKLYYVIKRQLIWGQDAWRDSYPNFANWIKINKKQVTFLCCFLY